VRQLIKRILREETRKDLSPIIKELLNTSIGPKYKRIICTFDAIPPWKTVTNSEDYQIMVSVIGGPGSKRWPNTQDKVRERDAIVNDVWHTVYNFIGLSTDVFLRNVKSCDEVMSEGLRDTSWQNDDGDKVTLIDLLNATEDIPVKKISLNKIKSKLLTWDDNDKEIAKIEKANLQYPILIFVDDNNKFISIIDGHHRGQKAVRHKLKTIKAKLIPINSLPKKMKKVFSHLGKQEDNEGAGAYDAPAFEMEPDHTTFKHEQSESKETNRKDLDFFDLVDKGIIFITEPFGNGKKQKSNWEGDSNIITLWNLKHPEKGQEWVFDAIKYPKPEAIQWWNDEGQFTLKDEKYNQILRSIKMYDNSSKQEQKEAELTERCWKGYTQKGMKTMFGKRYPNCVKAKK
jgi:hypothetical protein